MVAQDKHPFDQDFSGHIRRRLTEHFEIKLAEADELSTEFRQFVQELATFILSGGKRLRPTFAWWAWRACDDDSGLDDESVLSAVSALELLQAAALIHDDVIDASALRRGFPTAHVVFGQQHQSAGWIGDSVRFGDSTAVLLGDLAFCWADDLLRSSGLPLDVLARINLPWRLMRTEMIAGQYLDTLAQAQADESIDTALRIDELKTAAYTVEQPLHLGAALADAPANVTTALRQFGTAIGIAFQLRDDLLGVFGDSAVTGKPAGDDLREGKRTVLVAVALHRAEQARRHTDAAWLRSALGNQDLTEVQLDKVRELLADLGAVTAVENRITALTEQALTTLASAELADPGAAKLNELAMVATKRLW